MAKIIPDDDDEDGLGELVDIEVDPESEGTAREGVDGEGEGEGATGAAGPARTRRRDDDESETRSERRLREELEERDRRIADITRREEERSAREEEAIDNGMRAHYEQLRTQIKQATQIRANAIVKQDAKTIAEADELIGKMNRDADEIVTNFRGRLAARDARKAQAASAPQLNGLAKEWAGRNKWFNMADNTDYESNLVKSVSVKIGREGIAPDDPKHFEVLEQRLRSMLPHRFKDASGDAPRRKATTSAGSGGGAAITGGGTARRQVPAKMLAAARAMGLDTGDKKVLTKLVSEFENTQKRTRRG